MDVFDSLIRSVKRKLFGPLVSHRDFIEWSKKPAFSLQTSEGNTFSQFGGTPNLPPELEWPNFNGEPLSFLCRLAMEEIPSGELRDTLPPTGILYFFYDDAQTSWGFDPDDKGSWRVLYTPKSVKELQNVPSVDQTADPLFSQKGVEFVPVVTYPNCEDQKISFLNLSDGQYDKYFEMCESAYDYNPKHQLLGYPLPEQANDMRRECEYVSNDVSVGHGYPDFPDDPDEAEALKKEIFDWILLLQVDSDVDCRMQWGDLGKLYFWIKKDDLANCRFENCWMILQCG